MTGHPLRDELEKIRTLAAQSLSGIDHDPVTTLLQIELTVKRALQKLPGAFHSSPPIAIGNYNAGFSIDRHGRVYTLDSGVGGSSSINPALTVADGI
jgi:hypothetical protein